MNQNQINDSTVIQVNKVSKGYKNNDVLKNLSINIEP